MPAASALLASAMTALGTLTTGFGAVSAHGAARLSVVVAGATLAVAGLMALRQG
ncbi:MAG TPA: hypothetical protein VNZ52_04035 [Candidatus Thermoplasmatota archaeon]|nr:hypothetical protein [Candidatus Thermoplasmatota archaeon]